MIHYPVSMMAHPIAALTTAARCLAMPVCDAFSIAKIKTGVKRHLPQFHRTEAAGLYGTSVPTYRNVAVGGRLGGSARKTKLAK